MCIDMCVYIYIYTHMLQADAHLGVGRERELVEECGGHHAVPEEARGIGN